MGPNFAISSNPSVLTVPELRFANFAVTIQALNNVSGTEDWSLNLFVDRNGADCFLTPSQITFNSSALEATARLNCNQTTQGTYHFQIAICKYANSVCFYSSYSLMTLIVVPAQPPQPDFDLMTNFPTTVMAGQTLTLTIGITPKNGFDGSVELSGAFPGELSCGTISPFRVGIGQMAKLTCAPQQPGTYTIAITGTEWCSMPDYSGECSQTSQLKVTVLSSFASPVYIFAGVGGLFAVLEISIRGLIRRLRRSPKSQT